MKSFEIFGRPYEGVHRYRLFGVAAVDFIFTCLAALAIAYYTNVSFAYVLIILLILGIIAHYVFYVNTALNVTLGLGRPEADAWEI
jgi:hypothetical protein